MGEQHLADGQHFVGAQAGDAGAAVYQGVVVDQEAGGVMGMANAGGGAEDLDVHGFSWLRLLTGQGRSAAANMETICCPPRLMRVVVLAAMRATAGLNPSSVDKPAAACALQGLEPVYDLAS